MTDLTIMVAPNGARKNQNDHPNLPLTTEAIAREAAACRAAGAQAIHLHVRDGEGRHALDASRYLAASDAIRRAAGLDSIIQITTEAVGKFSPAEQIEVVRAVQPEAVSIAMKELVPDASAEAAAKDLFRWAHAQRIAVQHIVYTPDELDHLLDLMQRQIIPGARHSLIFPLGRYASAQESDPAELIPFVAKVQNHGGAARFDWWVCAFGAAETTSLTAAAALGGHCRIGFENSFLNSDGTRAQNNSERIEDLKKSLHGIPRSASSREQALRHLGKPD